jgi:hypothetical protein
MLKRIRRWVGPLVLAPLAVAAALSSANAALVISAGATSNVSCSSGTCTATATDAVLNAGELRTLLRGGDVRVDSGPAGSIAVNAALVWTQGSRLTLAAGTAISVSQPIVVEGHGAVTLMTGDTSPDALAFVGRGRLDFWDTSSSMVVNGQTYTLANNVASLASAIAANTSGNFALARSYDAKTDAPYTASPVNVLYGSLNGLGHVISGLRIQSSEGCAGFIAYLVRGTAPSVSNLALVKISLTQTWNGSFSAPRGTGGLAGCSQGDISHVRVTGHVDGGQNAQAGGIVGWQAGGPGTTGAIIDTSADVVLTGSMSALLGGIVSYDDYGSILRCNAAGRIEGAYAGGLLGMADFGSISSSWSSVKMIGNIAGGLVAWADGGFTLSDSYASGSVASGGGLIGKVVGGNGANTVQRAFAHGVVRGGGTTGSDDGSGAYANVYWDKDKTQYRSLSKGVSNIPNEPGVTGLSDTQLRSGLPAGFDPAVWGQNASFNNGYPYLLANPPQ